MELTVSVMKLHSGARMPRYATPGAAGIDLHGCLEEPMELLPGEIVVIPTGLALAIPAGWVGLVRDRSGLAVKGVHTLAGVIDSDYRGEVKIALHNAAAVSRTVHPGDRIAQMLILPCPQVRLMETTELPATDRGTGGFGSTGR